jgi:hypothetical protein
MGVLYDYFRAPGVAEVQRHMATHDGGSPVRTGSGSSIFDGVELSNIDHAVALGKLIGFALNEPWSSDLIGDRLVWPEGGEQDTEYAGPWVAVLGDPARDVLAGIPALRVAELTGHWAGIEEFGGQVRAEDLRPIVDSLSSLAGRARERGESLFCWICI